MKAFILTGGSIAPEHIFEKPNKEDLVISADAGYQNALRLGFDVDVAVGDFDTMPAELLPKTVERIQVPAEKDVTDTQLAVEYAVKQGATELIIIGGLGGRLDHTLSNLAILEDMATLGIHTVIIDGGNRARLLCATSTLIPRHPHLRYLSLLAVDEKVKGVCVEGCRYPLKRATLRRSFQYAVSNEITENCALISVRRGRLLIVESSDI